MSTHNGAWAREISLSFDDAPRASSFRMSGKKRTQMILDKLKMSDVKRVAFYVNTRNLHRDGGLERLKMYKSAGHLVGNHTHSHPNIKKITTEAYLADFEKADRLLKANDLLDPFFRYPYLRRGKNLEEINKVHQYVLDRGYTDAFITIDNYDWYLSEQYLRSLKLGHRVNIKNLEKYYVETLYQCVLFYEELSKKALNKDVKHIMLLHENDLAALFMDSFINKLKSHGWKIISPEESYQDEVTRHFPSTVLNHGSGRVNALSVESNYNGKLTSGLESKDVLDQAFKDYQVLK